MVLNQYCPTCNEPAHLKCTGCRDIQYCSKECQETDRPSHKLICHTNYTERPKDRPDVRRVLFFPEDSTQPDMLWVEVAKELDDNGKLVCQQPKIEELMETPFPEFDMFRSNAITGAQLDYHIHLCYDGDVSIDEENLNKAVSKATHGMAPYPWCGPMLAFCGRPDPDYEKQDDADIIEVMDMDMTAYSHVVAYLLDREHVDPRYLKMKGPKIHAVEISCDGALQLSGERYRAVQIPRLHPRIRKDDGEISQISNAIGVNLVCLKWRTPDTIDNSNSVATTILARLTFARGGFGYPSTTWPKDKIGNVIIFRDDFSPLDVDSLRAFVAYCKPIVQKCRKAEHGKLSKDAVLASISEEAWVAFLEKWLAVKVAVAAKQTEAQPKKDRVDDVEIANPNDNEAASGHH